MGNFRRMQGAGDRPADNTPVEMPLGARRAPSLADQIARMVHQAIEAEKGSEYGSWEEEDDFEEEDPDVLDFSKYELQELQEEMAIRDYGPDPDGKFGAESVGHKETGDPPDPDAEEPS